MEVTLYLADRRINAFMRAADLCDPGKVYIRPHTETIDRQGPGSTQEFLTRILRHPFGHAHYWVAAVSADGEWAIADGVTQLSDGKQIMFIQS